MIRDLLLTSALVTATVTPAPNIVLVTVEDLAWGDVSWHNPEVIMPNIATLASTGVILESAYVQPSSGSSQASLLTGKYPSRTGQQFISPNNLEPVGLPLDAGPLLPEHLARLGYSSHMLGRWSQGFCSAKYLPTSRGFSSFYGTWASGGDHYNHIASADPRSPLTTLGYDFHEGDSTLLGNIRYNKMDLLVDRFEELLYQHFNIERGFFTGYPTGKMDITARNTSNPFFILLNFDNLKLPLDPEERFEEMYPYQSDPVRRRYLAAVSNLDDAVGRIMATIRRYHYTEAGAERNLFEDTVIVFTSTSGGLSSPLGPVYSGSSSGELRGQHGDLLEAGVRVPAFVTNLGHSNLREDTLLHLADWLPTLYTGLGGGHEADLAQVDGVNQVDVLRGKSEDLRTEVLIDIANFNTTGETKYTHVTSPDWPANFELGGAWGGALRMGRHKLSVGCVTRLGCARNYNATWAGNADTDIVTLYDLAADPAEETDLAGEEQYADTVAELLARLRWHSARAVAPLHADFDTAGLPLYSFPPGQFFTGWCEGAEYEAYKNITAASAS